MFFADMHCDTLTGIMEDPSNRIALRRNSLHVDLEKMKSLGEPLQFFAIWTAPDFYSCAYKKTIEYIVNFETEILKNQDLVRIVKNRSDYEEAEREHQIKAFLTIEGAECLEGDLSRIDELYDRGIRGASLTWNYDNLWACGCNTDCDRGLSTKGRELIHRIQEKKMVLDVSHASDKTFWDIDDQYDGILIASHSNARAVRNHARNLTDAQLKAIADKDGVIGINLFSDFLTANTRATTEDICAHIAHMLAVAGEDHVGFGCDFEGMPFTPEGISDVSDMQVIGELLSKRFGTTTAEKIMGKNVLRVTRMALS